MRTRLNHRDKYISDLFAVENQLLKTIRARMDQEGESFRSLSSYEGKILSFLARLIKARKVVEIGSLYGYSAVWLAQTLPIGGKVYAVEKSQACVDVARELLKGSPVEERIEFYCGEAKAILPKLSLQGPFDMVFVDANKSSYPEYLQWAAENLREGGLVVGDNTFLFGHVYGAGKEPRVAKKQIESMKAFNQGLAQSKDFEAILIPTNEGMTVGQKKFAQ